MNIPNNNQTTTTIKLNSNKLDTKVMNMMLTTIIDQVQSANLYKEEQGVVADYEQIQYALDALYKYLYDQQNSNLSSQDATLFAAYLVEKMKDLKIAVEKIDASKTK
jgi:hypothetical protein